MSISVTAIEGAPFGAVVEGWNPAEAPDDALVSAVADALQKHLLLAFRGHKRPTDEQLAAFGAAFGPLIKGSGYFGNENRLPEILPVTNRLDEHGVPLGVGSSSGCDWHADYSYMPTVGDISFLECTEHPAAGGATYFCNMYEALETLPDELLNEVEGKSAFHDALNAERNTTAEDAEKKRASGRHTIKQKPAASHPVIVAHPRSGRKTLYVNPMLTRYIKDVSAEKSHRVLEEIFAEAIRPERIYKHSWRKGDMVVWDTIGTVHRRDSFPSNEIRDMRQMSTLFEI